MGPSLETWSCPVVPELNIDLLAMTCIESDAEHTL